MNARGFTVRDELLTWNADGRGVVVADIGTLPGRIDLVDPRSGQRTTLKDLAPPDRSGVVRIANVHWLADGRGYAYAYQYQIGQLFIVSDWQRR